ncbi:hypothetical protein B0H19DRAFT_1129381 [Mycena capillaripes]|nr:hypothetical protein B0H19DRAFT_1129381 [Mycena capillaripes]
MPFSFSAAQQRLMSSGPHFACPTLFWALFPHSGNPMSFSALSWRFVTKHCCPLFYDAHARAVLCATSWNALTMPGAYLEGTIQYSSLFSSPAPRSFRNRCAHQAHAVASLTFLGVRAAC